jgi:epoxyqueuosine reductase
MLQKEDRIKQKAAALGFFSCGIAQAGFLEEEAPRLEKWLNKGMHGEMAYMANHFDKRLDPTKLVPGAKSVISLLYNYFPPAVQIDPEAPKISKYAYGRDYHKVLKKRLKPLMQFMQEEFGDIHMRCFVDSAPVLEKTWAQKAGLGWVGKNANLLSKQVGSFFFITEIITDLELKPDAPTTDHCGTCRKCIDACPTDAIVEPYVVDGSRCISYFTIELKDAIPPGVEGKFENWAFGCDICQDVCPWNRFSKPHSEPEFGPNAQLLEMRRKDWVEMNELLFDELFQGSAVKRTKYEGLKRNIRFLGIKP